MKTAILDLEKWVEIIEIDMQDGFAWVRDEDGGEEEVSIERLDNIEETPIDFTPLEVV